MTYLPVPVVISRGGGRDDRLREGRPLTLPPDGACELAAATPELHAQMCLRWWPRTPIALILSLSVNIAGPQANSCFAVRLCPSQGCEVELWRVFQRLMTDPARDGLPVQRVVGAEMLALVLQSFGCGGAVWASDLAGGGHAAFGTAAGDLCWEVDAGIRPPCHSGTVGFDNGWLVPVLLATWDGLAVFCKDRGQKAAAAGRIVMG